MLRPFAITCLPVLVLVLSAPVAAQDKAAPDNQKIAVCANDCLAGLEQTLASALTSADVDKACSVYVPSDDVLAIESSGRIREGMKGLREMYSSAFAESRFLDVKFEFERTHLEETYGISYFKLRATLQTIQDQQKWEFYVQGTWVLQRRGDQWLIRHEHFSPIFQVDRVRPLDAPAEDPRPPTQQPQGPADSAAPREKKGND